MEIITFIGFLCYFITSTLNNFNIKIGQQDLKFKLFNNTLQAYPKNGHYGGKLLAADSLDIYIANGRAFSCRYLRKKEVKISVVVSHMPSANYEIDYMRYYKLTAANSICTTVATNLCSLSSYYRKVYKSITTNNTCSLNINPGTWNSSYTLRATDYVLLDVPTGGNSITINPTGTGYFAIDIVPCP